MQACSSQGCQISPGGAGLFFTTFPRIQLAAWQNNLLGVCKTAGGGGLDGLVDQAFTICSAF